MTGHYLKFGVIPHRVIKNIIQFDITDYEETEYSEKHKFVSIITLENGIKKKEVLQLDGDYQFIIVEDFNNEKN